MKKLQTAVLNNAIKWASKKDTNRRVSVTWSRPWHDKDVELRFSVDVANNDLSQYATLPDEFKGDISTLLCQSKQEKLTNELESLTERIKDIKAGCK